MFYKDERTILLIDGANLFSAAKALGFDIDYNLLRKEIMKRCRLTRAIYYTSLYENDEYSPIRPLVDWLNYNGYQVRLKTIREYFDGTEKKRCRGNFEVDLTVDALEVADRIDHVVLFSGDSDYVPLLAALQRKGIRVSIVSTMKSKSPIVSDELRRQADVFIELDDLRETIGRAIKEEQ